MLLSPYYQLLLLCFFLQFFLIGFKLDSFLSFIFGIIVTMVGFTLFLIGVDNSLIALGELAGKKMIERSKLWFILSIGLVIGFAITVAEPGVLILSNQLDLISNTWHVSKYLFIITVSLGIGIFLGLATIRFIYKISLQKILIFSYALIFLLILFCPKEFLVVAFDAGGVTTGPTTVPLILSLGIGMASLKGTKQQSYESFGFVGLASVGPIIAVLLLGVFTK
jgi:hypothetical protein